MTSETGSVQPPLYVSEEEVQRLLTWEKTLEAVEASMRSVAEKEVSQSPRSFTSVAGKGALMCMPGYLRHDGYGALGCKLVTAFASNLKLRPPLQKILANVMLFDDATGVLKAVIAGTTITTWRTAAASVAATKHIYVNNGKHCNILAILGAGVQGRIHAEMFMHFFKFQEIRLWNRTPQKAKDLAKDLNVQYNTSIFVYFDNNEAAVRGADVIVTATSSSSPIMKWDWVKPGAHVNAVGAGEHHHSELAPEVYLSSDIFIDYWEGAGAELSGLEKMGVKFKGLIGGAITGDVPLPPPGRVTVFQSLGMAVEDCAVARAVYDLYNKNKV